MLESLRRSGIVRAPDLSLCREEVLALHEHLDQCRVWNAHVTPKATEPPVLLPQALAERRWPMLCHDMESVVVAPCLLELALGCWPIAREYFGEPAVLYSMNAFWTQPAPGPDYQDTHSWHRDGDDRKQLVLFLFGTDVDRASDGAHLYQAGTHRLSDGQLGRDFRAPPPEVTVSVTGKAGTAFLADTGGVHMGLRPSSGPRLLLWARWGVSEPPQSYHWDRLSPVPRARVGDRYPSDPELQRAVRFVVA